MNDIDRILVGASESHVEMFDGGVLVHREAKAALIRLKHRAEKDGIQLTLISGFRGFEAQLKIWNLKCQGKRELLDEEGQPLDYGSLNDDEIVSAILRWSALPGASRHHWGTDFDVFDAVALAPGKNIQLVPQEAAPGGPFERFSQWLDENLAQESFFRPYVRDLGGVSPEWWHISYEPLSMSYLKQYSLELLRGAIQGAAMEKKAIVEKRLSEIYKNYVINITPP